MKAAEHPGMAMASLDEIPPRDSVAEIAEVTDPDERDEFNTVMASAFEMPLDVVEQVDQAALAYNVAFSGDIYYDDTRLFNGAVNEFPRIETLVMESTYGGRNDYQIDQAAAEEQLMDVIQRTYDQGGKVLIPLSVRLKDIRVSFQCYIDPAIRTVSPVFGSVSSTGFPNDIGSKDRELCRSCKCRAQHTG